MINKKERPVNSISTQQWLHHFESLLNDGHDADNGRDNMDNELDIELDEPSDEIEEHNYN